MTDKMPDFPYNPKTLERELCENYIPATQSDISQMLKICKKNHLNDLFDHIDEDNLFNPDEFFIEGIKDYNSLAEHVYQISKKNIPLISFIADGLTHFSPSPIVGDICSIRGLTTAYTPYQPERSQGTLQSLWVYQSILSQLTGFEAVNASLYERSTGIFEAIKCGLRLFRKECEVVIIDSLYPADKEVLETLVKNTGIKLNFSPLDPKTAQVDLEALKNFSHCGVIVFSQITSLGTLEKVNLLTDFAIENKMKSVAIIDPILLANNALKEPSQFGSQATGIDIIVGEAQNLALDKNFGGPGLGIFAVRYNESNKTHIRQAPGRYIGKAKDLNGVECKSIILSTREQHIRREKATSNICSNQSFVATLAGANLLHWGSSGLEDKMGKSRNNLEFFINHIKNLEGIEIAFDAPCFSEITLKLSKNINELINLALKENLEIGVDVSKRLGTDQKIKIFFNDNQSENDLMKLISFFKTHFKVQSNELKLLQIPKDLKRVNSASFNNHSESDVVEYYQKLGKQNLSPDDGIYPLGSCTMKYNPYINDFCASFENFTTSHPQSSIKHVQGNLEILFEVQEFFKNVTGLAGVTTQPVAGAQGELVGLKLFQAYHNDLNQQRGIILIPRSAHGTNPATAQVAGYKIMTLESTPEGEVDIVHLDQILNEHGPSIAGIMITNPNTAGLFERNFKLISQKIHNVGGLVYMDGANMNAIAGFVNLNAIGVDAVHNNLHKTWTIPHGGGGPGDAIVAVSDKLVDFLPGVQVHKNNNDEFSTFRPSKSIGSFHRHWGNFAHKVRCYTYIKALGSEGVRKMSSYSVLSARYLFKKLKTVYPTLPFESLENPRMHEFILTLSQEQFNKIESIGIPKSQVIARVGKLFLDFGYHAPTVAFPEVYGLMVEPTESFTKDELDQFFDVLINISKIINERPEILKTVPHFTPITRVDELSANKKPILSEHLEDGVMFRDLITPLKDKIAPKLLKELSINQLTEKIYSDLQ